MFCYVDFIKKRYQIDLPTEIDERISVDSLPICMACIESQNSSYSEILNNDKIHLYTRYLYVLIKGMSSVAETYARGLSQLIFDNANDRSSTEAKARLIVDNTFKNFHLFYDPLIQHYSLDFNEKYEPELIHEEIKKRGLHNMLENNDIQIKHIIYHTYLLMMHNQYFDALNWLTSIPLILFHTKRHSFARSVHFFNNEQILLIGTALTEGEAEYFALKQTVEIIHLMTEKNPESIEHPNELIDLLSRRYVIERKMYQLLRTCCKIPDDDGIISLFKCSNSFVENPCLFPQLLKSSDEINLLTFKKLVNEIIAN